MIHITEHKQKIQVIHMLDRLKNNKRFRMDLIAASAEKHNALAILLHPLNPSHPLCS